MAPVILLAAALAVVMSGCMRLQVEYGVNPDDTVSTKGVVAFDDSFLEEMAQEQGVSVDEFLEQSEIQTELEGSLGGDGDVTLAEYAADGHTGWSFTADEPQPLESVNGIEGSEDANPLTLVRQGDEFILSGQLDLSSEGVGVSAEMLEDPETAEMIDQMDIEFVFTFPGKVKSSTGAIDGNKVTFKPEFGEVVKLDTVAAAKEGLGSQAVILAAAAGAIVVVAVIVIVLLTARKKRAARQGAGQAA
jgi:hypothetical protein